MSKVSLSPFLEAVNNRLHNGWTVVAASYKRNEYVVMELRRGQSTRMFTVACSDVDLMDNFEELADVTVIGIGARHAIKHT